MILTCLYGLMKVAAIVAMQSESMDTASGASQFVTRGYLYEVKGSPPVVSMDGVHDVLIAEGTMNGS